MGGLMPFSLAKRRPKSDAPAEPDWLKVYPGRTGDAGLNAQNVRLRAACRDEGRRVIQGLEAIGLLTQLEYALLLQHVTAVAMYLEAQHAIARLGLIVEGDRGQWTKNPAVTIANNQVTVLKSTMPPLGLTPSARNFSAMLRAVPTSP